MEVDDQDSSHVDSSGWNASLLARIGDAERLEALLRQSPGADLRDNRGWYPLHEAVFARSLPCLRLILSLGTNVDVNATAHDGRTPLILAALTREPELIEPLVRAGADVNRGSLDELRPLQAAIGDEDKGMGAVEALLRAGADPNGLYWLVSARLRGSNRR